MSDWLRHLVLRLLFRNGLIWRVTFDGGNIVPRDGLCIRECTFTGVDAVGGGRGIEISTKFEPPMPCAEEEP